MDCGRLFCDLNFPLILAMAEALTSLTSRGAWDVVLVDSRFRVACALKSFLHFHREKSQKSLVLVHDFTRLRPYYQDGDRPPQKATSKKP